MGRLCLKDVKRAPRARNDYASREGISTHTFGRRIKMRREYVVWRAFAHRQDAAETSEQNVDAWPTYKRCRIQNVGIQNTSARRLANVLTLSLLHLPDVSCTHRAYVGQTCAIWVPISMSTRSTADSVMLTSHTYSPPPADLLNGTQYTNGCQADIGELYVCCLGDLSPLQVTTIQPPIECGLRLFRTMA